ncbi:carbohydrate sulfotransferase 1-like [Anneissia japonica]|uniref:carbohydrate sulfotransferase 1-like n=1 Tax=Anneissia japonica TaxID=1529436 RepID=UPI001425A678|nr:carbohydrate sulfotransferase 1-like [Anneissia japonica]XP_033103853.1 carbohydrate sulfotransferase 1-like [Anneissia japonica]XP_033103854.1 carbohydrate sulfotransferase 1-like [Anneissia japonica]
MGIYRLFVLLCMLMFLFFIATFILYRPITLLHKGELVHDEGSMAHSIHSFIPRTKTQVVLMTFRRSGSTFTGELFGNNPRSFYLFEPLHFLRHFGKRPMDPTYIKNISRSTLEAILSCQFNRMPFRTLWYHDFPDYMCFYGDALRSTSFCSFSHLPLSTIYNEMSKKCKQSDLVAIKTIRLFKIRYLERFAANSENNLKVIHLVRDPRGTIFSNKRYFKNSVKNITTLANDLCTFIENTRERVEYKSIWSEDRYMELKYEELSLNPLKVAKRIYDFIGFSLPSEVEFWIRNNTNVTNVSNGSMVVAKNSKTVPFAWRQSMDFQDVLSVQSMCSSVMVKMGYRLLDNEEDLRNSQIELIH